MGKQVLKYMRMHSQPLMHNYMLKISIYCNLIVACVRRKLKVIDRFKRNGLVSSISNFRQVMPVIASTVALVLNSMQLVIMGACILKKLICKPINHVSQGEET